MVLRPSRSGSISSSLRRRRKRDAVITGVLTVCVAAFTSLARATIVLKACSGERLWGGDFQPRSTYFKKVKDTVKFGADISMLCTLNGMAIPVAVIRIAAEWCATGRRLAGLWERSADLWKSTRCFQLHFE